LHLQSGLGLSAEFPANRLMDYYLFTTYAPRAEILSCQSIED
jgi:hypothetical protein